MEPDRHADADARIARRYRWLMSVYPAAFREEYGQDATELFVDQWGEARAAGFGSRLRLLAVTVLGAVVHGVLERAGEARRRGTLEGGVSVLRAALLRTLRAPALSATVVLTLGLGIGANVALYSVLSSVLIRPLPYPESDRLVRLWEVNPDTDAGRAGPSPWNFVDWSERARGFESMAAWFLTSGTYRTDAWSEEIRSAQVTPDFFRTLGVQPMLGRDFRAEEVDRYGPVILSHSMWSRLFGSDPSIVGTTIVSSGQSYEVIGVMPPDFTFPDPSVESWVAWDLRSVYADRPEYRGARFLHAVARLDEETSVEDAAAEMRSVAEGLERAFPDFNEAWSATTTSLHEEVVGEARGTLWVAFGAVLSILLIACANVANLLLARVPARASEIGLRSALGASRRRLALEVGAEHVVLGIASGCLGALLGTLLVDRLVALDAGRIPRLNEVSIDGGVFLFTVCVALFTSVLFGSAPIAHLVRATGGQGRGGTRTIGGREHRTLRSAFVGAQLAVALVLLTGAGVFTTSLRRLAGVDPGLNAANVATFRVSLDPVEGTAEEIVRYYRGLEQRILELPGVVSVGASQALPLNPVTNDFQRPYRAEGTGLLPAQAPTVNMRIVTAGYVEAMGMRLLEGPGMPAALELDEPLVAVINRTLAERLYPGGSAVGSSFEIDFREGWQSYRVVGVVEDVRHYGPRLAPVPEAFLAHDQVPYLAMTMAVRTTDDPYAMFGTLDEAVRGHVPMQPPHHFVAMDELVLDATAEERFLSILLGFFALVGLVLAGTGVYAVIAYSVGHRRREIGVRIALGADGRAVVVSVLADVGRAAAAGIVAGGIVVLLLGRFLDRLLYGVTATHPGTAVMVIMLLSAVAVVAAWAPARRAVRVQPSEALRAE